MTFEEVDAARKSVGITIAQLARETGVPYSTFTDWRAGRYKPKEDKLRKISTYLGLGNEYDEQKEIIHKVPADEDVLLAAYRAASIRDKNIVRQILGLPLIEDLPIIDYETS